MIKTMLKVVPLIMLSLILPGLVSCRPETINPQQPRILILEPSADSTTSSPNIRVKTFVDFFNLVDKTGQANIPGEGHIIYYMDVTPPTKANESALTAEGTYFITTDLVHIWQNVPAGAHIFTVQLVTNNNTSLNPPTAVRSPINVTSK